MVEYSTKPEFVTKPCNVFQGDRWCWPRYKVCDMKKETGCDEEPSIETIRCTTSPFSNNITGIESNLHIDLEGSTVSSNETFKNNSLVEGFKEGVINAAAADRVRADAERAGAQAKAVMGSVRDDVVRYGGNSMTAINNSKGRAETGARGAETAANLARNKATAAAGSSRIAETKKNDATYYADVTNQKMNSSIVDAQDTETSEAAARGDRKDSRGIRRNPTPFRRSTRRS